MPEAARRAALEAGLQAYARGDFFLAHEILEPAWMGAADVAERELFQGLIKLAAAFVHAVRGNEAGVAKNLRGALARVEAGRPAAGHLDVDAEALAGAIRTRLEAGARPSSTDDGRADRDPLPVPRRWGRTSS